MGNILAELVESTEKRDVSGRKLVTAGIFIEGIVVSSRARAFPPKDGKGASISVQHEIALNPGLATIEEYFDAGKDPGVKVKDLDVLEYPKLKMFSIVRVRSESTKIFNNRIVYRGITIVSRG